VVFNESTEQILLEKRLQGGDLGRILEPAELAANESDWFAALFEQRLSHR